MQEKQTVRIAIFASGGGSNARTLLSHFQHEPIGEICLLLTNNPRSGVFEFAPEYGVPVELLSRDQWQSGSFMLDLLSGYQVDLIVLAGYLKHVPDEVVRSFPYRILNIHPSLLPAHGGKGMYGMNVHKAVLAAGDAFSGISIHYVNEVYDEGEILFQQRLKVNPEWTPEDLQKAVQALEHQYFSQVVEKVCRNVLTDPNNS